MLLPVVNVFDDHYEVTSDKKINPFRDNQIPLNIEEEKKKQGKLIIDSHLDAAKHIVNKVIDNKLEAHIDRFLGNSEAYSKWLESMPKIFPLVLKNYQSSFPRYNKEELELEMEKLNTTLSDGQYLFHGGQWPNSKENEIILENSFSTSFCPQVALRNAEHRGKGYTQNHIDLFVLRTVQSDTKVFAYDQNKSDFGHEKEILFAKGAKLKLIKRENITKNYTACNANNDKKNISVDVIAVDIT